MYKVFSFTNTDEAAPYMDKKILRYIDEQITDRFECFKDCDILACILRPLAVANAFYNGRSAEHNGRPFLVIPSHIIGC